MMMVEFPLEQLWQTCKVIIGAWLLFYAIRALWNISPLSPLSHIPGPKLAAATYLPEIYYDVVCFGTYTRKIEEWHKKYGPIIRINPNEIHCNDLSFADEIYATGNRKRDKNPHQVSGSSMKHSGFATSDHDLHKLRRVPLAKFFSRTQITRLEPGIHALADRLCDKLLAKRGQMTAETPLDITMAYSSFTTDVISEYSFGRSFGFLEQEPDFESNFRAPLYSLLQTVFVFRFFPLLETLSTLATPWLTRFFPADMALLVKTRNVDIPHQIQTTSASLSAGLVQERDTIFGSLLASDLPLEEKSTARLTDEALAVLGAGTETTSWALTVITYHLLSKPNILARLTKELNQSQSQSPSQTTTTTTSYGNGSSSRCWAELDDKEIFPYLDAVIQEGLRLSYGVSSRTARVARCEDVVYKGSWRRRPRSDGRKEEELEILIPRGTAMGMSAALAHHDESVYPDSHAFKPERWLGGGGGGGGKDTDMRRKGLLSFSKGTRSCPGMNLALCELHLVLAALVERGVLSRMRLHGETTEKDVRYERDMFVPLPERGSKGVRVWMAE